MSVVPGRTLPHPPLSVVFVGPASSFGLGYRYIHVDQIFWLSLPDSPVSLRTFLVGPGLSRSLVLVSPGVSRSPIPRPVSLLLSQSQPVSAGLLSPCQPLVSGPVSPGLTRSHPGSCLAAVRSGQPNAFDLLLGSLPVTPGLLSRGARFLLVSLSRSHPVSRGSTA